jgi:hypothetical protein
MIMTLSSILIGIAIVTVCSIFFVAGMFHGSRRTEVARKARPMEIKDMAEHIGADLDFADLGKTHEGSRLLDAMVHCEDCQATDTCHHFLDAESEPASRIAAFCPNAVFLLGVTEGRKQAPVAAQGI